MTANKYLSFGDTLNAINTLIQITENAEISDIYSDDFISDYLYKVGNLFLLINDFENAEKYLKKAVELMPYDPIVNDHYGDILWMLNRKIQARYFWNNVLNLEETDDEMKIDVKKKIIYGIEKT